jgi:hypothetical protein
VWDSVWASVRASVGDSVWDSVWASMGASVGAYASSFFMIPNWKVVNELYSQSPFQCLVDLWESGLVPSYDGKTWRLHSGPQAKIIWEGKL